VKIETSKRLDQGGDLIGVLSPANATNADPRENGKIDPGKLPLIDVASVVVDLPSLKNGYPGNLWLQVLETQIILDRSELMVSNG
jgi:hypothetical protein